MQDNLGKKLEHRPEKENLEQRNILKIDKTEDTNINRADALNIKLASRPTAEDLKQKRIL